jgi:hypothetical protein
MNNKINQSKRSLWKKLAMTAVLATLSWSTASAKSVYIKTDGNDSNNGTGWSTAVKTINRAMAIAVDYDTIYMRAGTYTYGSTQTISKRVTLRAEDYTNRPVIKAATSITDWADLIYVYNVTGVTLNGLKIKDQRSGNGIKLRYANSCNLYSIEASGHGGSGIVVEESNTLLFSGCTIYDCVRRNNPSDSYYIQNWLWGGALSILQGSNMTIDGCSCYQNYGEGYIMNRVNNFTIKNSFSSDNYSVNIYVDKSKNGKVFNNKTTSSYVERFKRDGDYAYGIGLANEDATSSTFGCSNVQIYDNTYENTRYGVWLPRQGWCDDLALSSITVDYQKSYTNIWGEWIFNQHTSGVTITNDYNP